MRKLPIGAACMAAALIPMGAYADFEAQSQGPRLEREEGAPAMTARIRFSGGYDSNVQIVPDNILAFAPSDGGSGFFATTLEGSYRRDIGDMVTFGAAIRADKLWYTASRDAFFGDATDYNLTVVQPAIFLEKAFGPLNLRAAYDFRFEESQNVDGVGGQAHSISLAASRLFDSDTRLLAGLRHTWNDYGVVFPIPQLNERDGTRLSGYLGVERGFLGGNIVADGLITATMNDATGKNWDYGAFGTMLSARAGITEQLGVSGLIGYEWRDYRGFNYFFIPPPGRNREGILTLNAKVLYEITPRFTLDVFVEHSSYDSNSVWFDAERTFFGVGLTIDLL